MPCPSGTYLDQVGRYEESQCIACPGGKYCMGIHLTTNSGDCSAGEKELLPLGKIAKLLLFVRVTFLIKQIFLFGNTSNYQEGRFFYRWERVASLRENYKIAPFCKSYLSFITNISQGSVVFFLYVF